MITAEQIRKMFKVIHKYSHARDYANKDESLFFLDSEEMYSYWDEDNSVKCPNEWVGDTGTTSPAILVVPVGNVVDTVGHCWGIFENASISSAAELLVSIPSLGIPKEKRAVIAEQVQRYAQE